MKKVCGLFIVLNIFLVLIVGCGTTENDQATSENEITGNENEEKVEQRTIKISATSVPHAEMLEFIKEDLAAKGIQLEIIVSDEYTLHNRMLDEKEVDANFFQHFPYLEAQIADFGYDIEAIGKIHIEPMGLYSLEINSLDELKEGATIAIPNDPSNESRALALLHKNQIIQVDDVENTNLTILNIVDNPKNLKFNEIDAAMLPRTLEDVDAAVINTNFALEADLNPLEDAIIIEDADSPYVNIVAARSSDVDDEALKALVEALTSEKVRNFIEENYGGSIVPVF